jgi:hypothetical protein
MIKLRKVAGRDGGILISISIYSIYSTVYTVNHESQLHEARLLEKQYSSVSRRP